MGDRLNADYVLVVRPAGVARATMMTLPLSAPLHAFPLWHAAATAAIRFLRHALMIHLKKTAAAARMSSRSSRDLAGALVGQSRSLLLRKAPGCFEKRGSLPACLGFIGGPKVDLV